MARWVVSDTKMARSLLHRRNSYIGEIMLRGEFPPIGDLM